MEQNKILNYCIEKGVLLDREVLEIFTEIKDFESTKLVIEKIREYTKKKLITREVLNKNKDKVDLIFSNLSDDKKKSFEKLKIKMGLKFEISRSYEVEGFSEEKSQENLDYSNLNKNINSNLISNPNINSNTNLKYNLVGNKQDNKIFSILNSSKDKDDFKQNHEEIDKSNLKFNNSSNINKNSNVKKTSIITSMEKKPDVEDFIKYFRNRFIKIRNILSSHSKLTNLISMNKISGNRQGISLIGMISDKKITKNGNIILTLEDLTGSIRVLINKDRKELYNLSEDLSLDLVIGVKGSGNREIIFANDVIFPDSILFKRKKSPLEEYALFMGDLHYGSNLFLEDNFKRFISYLNGELQSELEVKKIKYIFIAGDIISGIGIYPNQEKTLKIKDLEAQFKGIAELLSQIRKDIQIIICPGNHDGVRIMEPQPLFDKKYAWPLYEMENVMLTTNPCYVNIGSDSKSNFKGFDVLMYHGFSYPFYADNVSSLIKSDSINAPDKIMAYLLKSRHLAPTHSSVQYYPLEEDPLFIEKIPDIFFSGHIHKMAVSYYNNILLISSASWESMTDYQEKLGNKPDFCKVPMLNLKTREIKILDFEK